MVARVPPGRRASTLSAAADDGVPFASGGLAGDDVRPRSQDLGDEEQSARDDSDEGLADALSVAGHELAQPLSVALACANLLTRESVTVDAELRQEVLDSLTRSLAQLQSFIDDFEVMGDPEVLQRSDEDPMARHRVAVPMRWVLEKAVEDFGLSHSRSRIELSCDGDLPVVVDLARFRQVLSNLLGNAEKFGDLGGTIQVQGRADGTSVIVSVHNQGSGFAAEEAVHIFEKSIRLDGRIRGRGWGLYVAKAIIDSHGGRLWAEGEPGKGATFFIKVPALQG
jgi:signal transduction histidine kinase